MNQNQRISAASPSTRPAMIGPPAALIVSGDFYSRHRHLPPLEPALLPLLIAASARRAPSGFVGQLAYTRRKKGALFGRASVRQCPI
jgi:hypothetical protein